MAAAKFKVEYKVSGGGKRAPKFTLDQDLNGEMTIEDIRQSQKDLLLSVAAEVLREEVDRGFPRDFITYVDGRKKPVEQVKPFGKIEFVSPMSVDEVLIATMEAIEERSKVVTGAYMRSHEVTFNGVVVARDSSSLASWLNSGPTMKPKDIITFINTQPYARRLERYGITKDSSPMPKGQKRTPGRPNGTYRLAYRSVRRKYRRNVKILFRMIPGNELAGLTGQRTFKRGRKGSVGRAYLYPSIQIIIGSDGGVY